MPAQGTFKTETVVVLMVTAVLAAGCGSSSAPRTTTTAQPPATTTTAQPAKPPEPKGRLSAGEYRALISARKIGMAVKHPSPHKSIALYRQTCREFAAAPATALILAERRTCARATRFVAVLLAFVTHKTECTRANQIGDASCYGELFSRLARATHTSIASALEVNMALQRRQIPSKCSSVIGVSSQAELREAAKLGRDARRASQLLYAHYDIPAYVAAVHAVQADINSLSNGLSDKQEFARMRRCPHEN